ncbi:hypothetical protein ESCO_004266 [Escovopsis weberi]|uniref:Uncharacterized protein n=1 Tax=Escovopsis weberi TaxID=150374 RepID=A0A0N0RTU1_ESCWE|nr:hypothetical protein ESCO_004266 [Escovopsis weberi]
MLRHKRRVLEEMVDYHGLASRILPFPSDMEEARAIQYRCEYLETICLQERKPTNKSERDLTGPDQTDQTKPDPDRAWPGLTGPGLT